jgi:hypothetical protein
MTYARGSSCVLLEDPFHREWNDCKLAIRTCANGSMWKTILHLKAAFDINYSPSSNPKYWFRQKQRAAERWSKEVKHTDDCCSLRSYHTWSEHTLHCSSTM